MIKKFTEAAAVSGCEKNVRDMIIDEIKDYCSSYEVDSMGNLIAFKKAKNPGAAKTVALSAHMDEVGLIITGINPDGTLAFDAVGGIDASVLISKKVKTGELFGVIGTKAVHLTTAEERAKKTDISSLYIDIGAKDKEDAKKYVMPGDYASFFSGYEEFGSGFAKAKALDDRLGCITLMEALKEDYNVNLMCFFVTQEETGLRGAKAAFYKKEPDYAIVVESTTAGDITGAKPHMKVTEAGGGAAISLMDSSSLADKELFEMLCKTAEKNGIKYQFKMAATGGNDAGSIHLSNGGIKTCSVSVPARYIHSPSSVCSLEDFYAVKNLIKAFLKSFDKEAEK